MEGGGDLAKFGIALFLCLAVYLLSFSSLLAGILELLQHKSSSLGSRARNWIAKPSFVEEEEVESHIMDWSASRQVQDKLQSLSDRPTQDDEFTVPGLWNGANYCFLNSTLQSMASVESLRPYLQAIVDLASTFESTAPVSAALLDLFAILNTPCSSVKVYKPSSVARALAESSPARNRLLNSDQQDAQELYLAIMAACSEELDKFLAWDSESQSSLGLGSALDAEYEAEEKAKIRNPLQSLLAHRIACRSCGYSEATRHLPTEQISLNAPFTNTCQLEEILGDLVQVEFLDEYNCRRCSINATVAKLQQQVDTARSGSAPDATPSKKKRLRETQRHINKLKTCLDEGSIEQDFVELKLERISKPASKQSMFSRPADALVIHISRSNTFTRGGMPLKNSCQVKFPEQLDLDAFCTTSQIQSALLTTEHGRFPLTVLEPIQRTDKAKYVYRIAGVVVHFGLHNYGHYVTYRRVRHNGAHQWFRMSDETVIQSTLKEVLASNPFLLFYDRVLESAASTTSTDLGRTITRADVEVCSRQK